jgi:hypothetical protein
LKQNDFVEEPHDTIPAPPPSFEGEIFEVGIDLLAVDVLDALDDDA